MIKLSVTHEAGKPTVFTAWDGKKAVEVTEKVFNTLPDGSTEPEVSEGKTEQKPKSSKSK